MDCKTTPLLTSWLEDVANDETVIDQTKTGIHSEAHPNMWSFSLTMKQAKETTVEDVENFLYCVMAGREKQFQKQNIQAKSITFYCWHDAQAGQLRFSLVSSCHGYLPFGAKLKHVSSVQIIIKDWLDSHYLEGIPFEEFEEISSDDLKESYDDNIEFILPVWSTQIPS